FEDMFRRLRENPDPDDPEIAQRTTGKTKAALMSSQATAKTLGERAEFGPETDIAVLTVDLVGTDAAVGRSCVHESLTLTNSAGVRAGPTVTALLVDYKLTDDAGRWRVASSEEVKRYSGQHPCEGWCSSFAPYAELR